MRIDKKIILGMFFLIGILLVGSFVSAYLRSIPQYYSPSLGFGPGGTLMGVEFSREMCEKGQDFIIQILMHNNSPFLLLQAHLKLSEQEFQLQNISVLSTQKIHLNQFEELLCIALLS